MVELVRVICTTNLDGYDLAEWPQYLYRPKEGDRVQSGNKRGTLKIVAITHLKQNMSPPSNDVPLLKIELHK